jgi:DNA-binding CsgD family transcriptional regulator
MPADLFGSVPFARESLPLSLLTDASSADARLLAAVSGARGAGKTTLLDELDRQFHAAGIPVGRDDPGLLPPGAGSLLLVDDAHWLDEPALHEMSELVEGGDVQMVVAYRPWPHSPALSRLVAALERYRPPVVLGAFTREEVAAHLSSVVPEGAPPGLVTRVFEATGGMPWLVDRVARAVAASPSTAGFATQVPPLVSELIGIELETLPAELHELLLALAVGFDLGEARPPGFSLEDIDRLVAEARAAAFLLPDGRLVPLVRQAILESTPAYRIRASQHQLVDAVTATGRVLDDVARSLAQEGLHDERVARSLEGAADAVLLAEPALASVLYDEAIAAGADELAIGARRAQALAAIGDLDAAGRVVDDLLGHDDAPDLARAVNTSAAIWAQRGMLDRSAEMFQWLGAERIGAAASLAVVAMIGAGDLEAADGLAESPSGHDSPTLISVATSLMGRGIRQSVGEGWPQALSTLVRASDIMTASGAKVPLPDSPAALAALVALHSGELDLSNAVLEEAIRGGQCGVTAGPRLLLLQAWTAMLADRPARARAAITEVTEGEGQLSPRDELLFRALEVGLARREDQAGDLLQAWQRARQSILHMPVDLYSLLPIGELAVAAARVRDTAWLELHLKEAWSLLARLGDPPLWSVPLRWSAIQAGILTDRPADLAPHAAALVKAAVDSRMAAVLAEAGGRWVSVLAGHFDPAAVESAARALASVGLTWDGSRLAGHAAARVGDRREMARLLACARDLHSSPSNPGEDAAASSASPHESRLGSTLSDREREVARLVLQGRTYREIGDALFVSPRTAEHHIAQIRRKLAATNRSELLTKLRVVFAQDAAPPGDPSTPYPYLTEPQNP